MIETYGLTKQEYRNLIESPFIKASDIAKKLILPDRIYRFRKLDTSHRREDLNGICKFSVPNAFSKNDNDDCRVYFNDEEVISYMYPEYGKKRIRSAMPQCKKIMQEYKDSLQGKIKAGCFTSAGPLDYSMWEDINFGDKGHGFCIEYEVNDENFRPDNLAFLPILYDDNHYDSTEAMKAVIDFVKYNTIESAAKLVCLGYGHTLIKPVKYQNEQEWRLVIPIRDDGTHLDYFNVDGESKRDMTPAIKAIYLGYNENCEIYKQEILTHWKNKNISIYQVIKHEKKLSCTKI